VKRNIFARGDGQTFGDLPVGSIGRRRNINFVIAREAKQSVATNVGSIKVVSLVSWRGSEWRRHMSKKFARMARLISTAAAIDSLRHPEVRAKLASKDGNMHGLATILRGPRKSAGTSG
jgi:hypothetical protein